MRETFTKGMARNIYYGGSIFFFLVLIGLTVDTVGRVSSSGADNMQNMTEQVAAGKRLWEINDCIGCHTLLGEGAYFAPELGNVYTRMGKSTDAIKGWIKIQPLNIPGRRQMPNFNFNDEELEEIAQFLKFVDGIKVARDWPPNIKG